MTDPRRTREPGMPESPWDPPLVPRGPPNSSGSRPPPPFIAETVADQAIPLAICYGTMKVPIKLIEKFSPQTADPEPWTPATTYAAGAYCSNHGRAYKTTAGGLSGPTAGGITGDRDGPSAPVQESGSFSDPVHGLTWDFVQQLPCPVYWQRFVGALCEGEIAGESGLWWDKEKLATVAGKGLILGVGPDAANQTIDATYDTCGYQHTALVSASSTAALRCFTGTQSSLPDIAVEVIGLKFGASSPDASAADIVNDLLTSFRRGAGWSSSRVHTSITGSGAGDFRVYCDAAGLRFSMLLDSQRTVLAWLTDILAATNSDAVWSQGQLKIKPLGDTAIPAPAYGGIAYVPANAAVYNLSTDDFLDTEQPVQYDAVDDADTFNRFPVQYVDRQLGYAQTTVDFPDQANADLRGVRDAGTLALPVCFADGQMATAISKILAQRSLRVTNTYRFRLDWRYILLEPTDVVTLSEDFSGLLGTPVRIVEMEEQDDGTLLFTCEDYPAGVAAATGYQPQTGSGYVSNDVVTTQIIPTTIDGVRSGIQNGVVTAAHGTQSSYPDNLWPNPTSEANPPPGADVNRPEWAGRFNAGVGAFAGSWVRQISTAIHSRVLLGDQQASAFADQSQLGYFVPCSPGDQFYIEAMVSIASATAGEAAGVFTWFLDASNALVGTSSTLTESIAPAAAWTKVSAFGTAPAGTVKVMLGLFSNCALGASTANFDAIYARRADIAPLDHTRTVISPYTYSNAWERTLKALDGEASTAGTPTAGLAFYRGNVDTTLNGGAPVVFASSTERISVFSWSGSKTLVVQPGIDFGAGNLAFIPLEIDVFPQSNDDNLDAMRLIVVEFFDATGASIGQVTEPFPDRKYQVPGTPTDATNGVSLRKIFILPDVGFQGASSAPFNFKGYVRITLHNAYGPAESRDFGPGPNTSAVWAHTTFMGLAPSGGGGGGSTYCPAPEALILLEDGTTVTAGELRDGMRVQGFQEKGSGAPAIGTIHYAAPESAQMRYLLTLADGRQMRFSKNHRLWLLTPGEWVTVQTLKAGDVLQGATTNPVVASVVEDGPGPVVGFVVEGTHTYFSDGVLSHNVKSSVP